MTETNVIDFLKEVNGKGKKAKAGPTRTMPGATKTNYQKRQERIAAKKAPKPLEWPSVESFRNQLQDECDTEESAPRHLGLSPRLSLRVPLMRALYAQSQLVDSVTLRVAVCKEAGLDPHSARIINLVAWALVDMKDAGFIESDKVKGKTLYRLNRTAKATMAMLEWQDRLELQAKVRTAK